MAGGDEVEITKYGLTVARLVPAVGPAALGMPIVGTGQSNERARMPRSMGFAPIKIAEKSPRPYLSHPIS